MKPKIIKIVKRCCPWLLEIRVRHNMRNYTNYAYKHHMQHSCRTDDTQTKSSYNILLCCHGLEKGMTNTKPRYFGISKVKNIIKQLEQYESQNWTKDFAYDLGVGILQSYAKFYEEHDWTDRAEYQTVKDFLKNHSSKLTAGIMTIHKKDFQKAASIDYDKFLSSRHSIRHFQHKKLSSTDLKKAVSIAIKTPTACNRQMLKVYYVENDKTKNKILKYSKGMTAFDNDSANMLIVTYDVSSLRVFEPNQGLFNAGLFAANLVNALHSLGIGSCMLQYAIPTKEEEEEKRILGITDHERIAIVIAAGYYPDQNVVPRSLRKPVDEVLKEI